MSWIRKYLCQTKQQEVSSIHRMSLRPSVSASSASARISTNSPKNPPQLPKGSAGHNEADIPPISERVKPLLDFQDMAPSPSQSFYQIALYPYSKSEKRRERRTSRASSTNSSPIKSPLHRELPELNHEKLQRGCVIVREWPRKRLVFTIKECSVWYLYTLSNSPLSFQSFSFRFSQGWTREGALNPSEIVLEFEDFAQGEMASHLTSIFGVDRYNQLVAAAKEEIQKKRKD